MANNLTIHLKMFNDKVKLMSQTQNKQLVLTAQEARNIHADLFDLLNHCATLSRQLADAQPSVISLDVDGGGFK